MYLAMQAREGKYFIKCFTEKLYLTLIVVPLIIC